MALYILFIFSMAITLSATFSALFSYCVTLTGAIRSRSTNNFVTFSVFTFSILGFVCGYLVGNSRTSAVGIFLGALLPFVTAFISVGFVKSLYLKIISLGGILSFSLFVLFGCMLGAHYREAYLMQNTLDINSYQYLKEQADIELAIRNYRRAIGLPSKD